MRIRSNAERRALFSKLALGNLSEHGLDSYAGYGKFSISPDFEGLNRKVNKEMFDGIHRRLKEKSLHEFSGEMDRELNSGIPKTARNRITSLFDNRDSYFEDNKFSDGFSVKLDIDPVKYTTGIIIEEAIRNYEMNRIYYDKYGISLDDLVSIELAKNNLLGNET